MKDNPQSSLRNLISPVAVTALVVMTALDACVPRKTQSDNKKLTAIVRGEIRKDGEPLPTVRVVLERITGKEWQYDRKEVSTGADGQFVFDNLGPGSYYFNIEFETRGAAPCTTNQPGFQSSQVNAASWHPLINAGNRNSPFPVNGGDDLKFTIDFNCPYREFDQHLSEYISFSKLENRNESPYISGKAVIVDERGMSKLHFDLPEEIRANDPKDVGTLVFMACKLEAVGYYSSSGAPASETVCEITLTDLKRKVVINKHPFREGAPDSPYSGGAWPRTDAIVKFIGGLPRR